MEMSTVINKEFEMHSSGVGIYSIVNLLNNKMYIGSSIDLYKRKKGHLNSLRKNKHHAISLQRAFNKYGENNFDFFLIENVSNRSDLMKEEQKWMDFFNPEYNTCKSSKSPYGIKRSEETRLKLRISHSTIEYKDRFSQIRKGAKFSEESKAKMRKPKSASHVENMKKSLNSEEYRIKNKDVFKKRGVLYKGVPQYHCRKPVIQLDLDGCFVKRFDCILDVEKELGIMHQSISNMLAGRTKTSGGFIWQYEKL